MPKRFLALTFLFTASLGADPFQFSDGDRVVFVGNTFIERAARNDYIETFLTQSLVDKNITFRNLGWSADTVTGESRAYFGNAAEGYGRLMKAISAINPTVVIANYGGNEAFEGKAGLQGFIDGYKKLLADFEKAGARKIVFLSPLRHESLGLPLPDPASNNENLEVYTDAIQRLAIERSSPFVNLFQTFGKPSKIWPDGPLTSNTMHLTPYGYWRAAHHLAGDLNVPRPHWELDLNADGASNIVQGTKLTDMKSEDAGLSFQLHDELLPLPPSPGPQDGGRVIRFHRLKKGKHALLIDKQIVAIADEGEWSAGVRTFSGPDFQQVEELRQTIREKNELFFHHWRPQNETYILGFRKGEQGRNAVEIPQFIPLVSEKEKAITLLSKPQPRLYQLMPENAARKIAVNAPAHAEQKPEPPTESKPAAEIQESPLSLVKASWIWFPKGNALENVSGGSRFFRRRLQLPQGAKIKTARFMGTADNVLTLWVNGKQILNDGNWADVSTADLKQGLNSEEVFIAAEARNDGDSPAGLIAAVRIEFEEGNPIECVTDEKWRSSETQSEGWQEPKFDDAQWVLAKVTAGYGSAPWGELRNAGAPPVDSNDPESERASFKMPEEFEVNLFAQEPMIRNPIRMNWDEQGRLWVATSPIYPHIKPGQKATDSIIILEDTDKDGVADKSTVFVDDLLIPTGVIPGDGGAYIANSTELIHLKDTDGDGRADTTHVVLSAFGTEDTHHILHTLRWGPGGLLYFNQSIYIHSHIETPYGVRRLNGSGIWQFQPSTMKLEVVSRGMVNPWGHHWDRWGQSFASDGAGGEGIYYAFPGSAFQTARDVRRTMRGLNPGQPKMCGLEILSGRHMPETYDGSFIVNDFRAHRVSRFVLTEEGSGYKSTKMPDLITSSNRSFRPVDVKMGPDGALYIADWYNPIINHGEVDFRDPRRDKDHGRIWRVTAKGRPLVNPPAFIDATPDALLQVLKQPEQWARTTTKRLLREMGKEKVMPALKRWEANGVGGTALAGSSDADANHLLLETLWVYQALDVPNPELLKRVIKSEDHRARAAAVRVLSHWQNRLPEASALFKTLVIDPHPQVRLETVNALRLSESPDAAQAAMKAIEMPMDPNLDFALELTMRTLEKQWAPKLAAGEQPFGGSTAALLFAVKSSEGNAPLKPLLDSFRAGKITPEFLDQTIRLLADKGDQQQLGALIEMAAATAEGNPDTSEKLISLILPSIVRRNIRDIGTKEQFQTLLSVKHERLLSESLRMAGRVRHQPALPRLLEVARSSDRAPLRAAAVQGLGFIGGAEAKEFLLSMTGPEQSFVIRREAVNALVSVDINLSAQGAVSLLSNTENVAQAGSIFDILLRHQQGPTALASALEGKAVSPEVLLIGQKKARSARTGRQELLAALNKAGEIPPMPRKLTPAQEKEILAKVKSQGDPTLGERIYRLPALTCQQCHAIGGAGGLVGPDISSLGASAPVDYLLDSILEPGKKIKEGYHTTTVLTKDDEVLSGTVIKESDTELILIDAAGEEHTLPADQIASKKITQTSLMPEGLTASLKTDEFIHLLRFLSEVGKGDFTVSHQPFVRRWRTLTPSPQTMKRIEQLGGGVLAETDEWTPAYSLVNGSLPLTQLPRWQHEGKQYSAVKFEIDVTQPGDIEFKFLPPRGLHWLEAGKLDPIDKLDAKSLTKGLHWLTVIIDQQEGRGSFSVEVSGGAKIIGGQ
ncbi:MAG: GDSL-type esterase/lipase family protein [Planctomycetota bacterium]|nr:GDSL-type esterase/lipase family protein [Planctomycetota bacterium]